MIRIYLLNFCIIILYPLTKSNPIYIFRFDQNGENGVHNEPSRGGDNEPQGGIHKNIFSPAPRLRGTPGSKEKYPRPGEHNCRNREREPKENEGNNIVNELHESIEVALLFDSIAGHQWRESRKSRRG